MNGSLPPARFSSSADFMSRPCDVICDCDFSWWSCLVRCGRITVRGHTPPRRRILVFELLTLESRIAFRKNRIIVDKERGGIGPRWDLTFYEITTIHRAFANLQAHD